MFSFAVVIYGGGGVTQVLGCRRYLRMYKMNNGGQQKTCCDSYRWEMLAICEEAAFFFFFWSALFAGFPYTPAAATSPAAATQPLPTRTGQQEIGIQCFLDDFLKEMNP